MGTFHEGLGDLHGITVVVETRGDMTYVGRCHEENDRHVVLHDADVHDAKSAGTSREAYLARAARYGVYAKHGTLVVPRGEVTSIRRLGESLGDEGPPMTGDDDDDLGEMIAAFLASDPIGVAGASQDPSKYGHRVLAALLESGRRAIPVHPKEKEILGAATVPSVAGLPAGARALSLITPPPVTEKIIAEALSRGFDRFWLQPGAESDAAIALAERAGASVIAGGPCILVALSQERGRRAAGGGAGGSRRG